MATHVEDLPDELLLRILDLLQDSDLIGVVPCVCLRWSRLSLDSHIWRNRTYDVRRQSDSDAVKFFSRKPALRSVAFGHPVDEAVLRSLTSHCPTITSLSLHDEQLLTLGSLRVITRNCDQICYLRVPSKVLGCPDCAREVALMPRLETLYVHGRHPPQLRELGAGCARLRHLDLRMADVCLGDLGAPLLRRLQGLAISLKFVSRDIVHCAESLEKLTLQNYHYYSRPDSALAEDLLPLKALTHVNASYLFRSPQVLRALMKPLLRSLDLRCWISLDDDLLLELCRRCPLLEDLDLSECGLITARGLSSMWSLQRLRVLYLRDCKRLRSGAMTHLACCDGLQELHIQGIDMNRMEPGVSRLLELRKLRVLSFEAWPARDLIPWELLPKAFPDLRVLYLGMWRSQDTSLPESLKAAMPVTQVKWHDGWGLHGCEDAVLEEESDLATESETESDTKSETESETEPETMEADCDRFEFPFC